jgi:aspartate/methionine/tyrosine aminotransferase
MSAPIGATTLVRPLAARIAQLPTAPEFAPDLSIDAPLVTDAVIAAASGALERGETHYTDRAGVPALRKLAADQLQARFGIALDPKEVTITCGVAEARFIALRILAGTGVVVCPDTALRTAIEGVCTLVGATLQHAIIDPAAVRVLYLGAGDLANEALIKAVAEQPSTYIVVDLSAAPDAGTIHPAQDSALRARVTTIDGLDYQMPGWRVGWLAGSDMADKLRSFKQSLTICTTSVSQWAAVELLEARHEPS